MTDTKSIPATPQGVSTADIKAILEARKQVKVEPAAAKIIPGTSGKIVAQVDPRLTSQAATATATVDPNILAEPPIRLQDKPAPVNTSDAAVEAFLEKYVPALVTLGEQFKDGVTLPEALAFGQQLFVAAQYLVAVGLPQMKGLEAKALALVLFRWAFRKYLAPKLGGFALVLEPALIKAAETLYQLFVKAQAKKAVQTNAGVPTARTLSALVENA